MHFNLKFVKLDFDLDWLDLIISKNSTVVKKMPPFKLSESMIFQRTWVKDSA